MRGTVTKADQWQLIEPYLPIGEHGPYPERQRDQCEGVSLLSKDGSTPPCDRLGQQRRGVPPIPPEPVDNPIARHGSELKAAATRP
jgi:hypothetical protein